MKKLTLTLEVDNDVAAQILAHVAKDGLFDIVIPMHEVITQTAFESVLVRTQNALGKWVDDV